MYKREEFIFSPTKKFIFTTKPRNITMKPKYTKQKLAPKQIHFTTFHPVLPLQRFGKAKIYNRKKSSQIFVKKIQINPIRDLFRQ